VARDKKGEVYHINCNARSFRGTKIRRRNCRLVLSIIQGTPPWTKAAPNKDEDAKTKLRKARHLTPITSLKVCANQIDKSGQSAVVQSPNRRSTSLHLLKLHTLSPFHSSSTPPMISPMIDVLRHQTYLDNGAKALRWLFLAPFLLHQA